MELLDKILLCDQSHTALTSQMETQKHYIEYTDSITPEIPLQNYIYIKRNISTDMTKEIVTEFKQRFYSDKRPFIRFVFDPYTANSGEIPELSDFTFYTHNILTISPQKTNIDFADSHCFPAEANHRTALSRLYYQLNHIPDITESHIARWIDIKLNTPHIVTVVFSKDNAFIGSCEIYFYGKIAKIDDLEVIESYRNRSIGNALLKSAISICKSRKIKTIYLISDSREWVSEYYQRRGFELYAQYNSCILYR